MRLSNQSKGWIYLNQSIALYLALLTSLSVYQVLASGFGKDGNGEPSEYLESVWLGSVPTKYYFYLSNVKFTVTLPIW